MEHETPSFDLLDEIDIGGLRVAVMRAALELDVCRHVADGADTDAALAASIGVSPRGVRILVTALLALGVLDRVDGRLQCTRFATAFLLAEGDGYSVPIFLDWMRNRDHLVSAIRTGISPGRHDVEPAGDAWAAFAAPDLVLWPSRVASFRPRFIERGLQPPPGGRIADLGCGSGICGFAMIDGVEGATAVAVDRPEVLGTARRLATAMGVESAVEFVESEVDQVELDRDSCDVILLINVAQYLHDAPLTGILTMGRRALRADGRMYLVTAISDEDLCRENYGWATLVEMYLASGVEQRSVAELTELIEGAGLRVLDRPLPNAFVLGR